jgi:hypothetical protein
VYDTRARQWMTDSYNAYEFAASASWDGKWMALRNTISSSDAIQIEDTSSFQDFGSTDITTRLELGDLRPFGIQGRGLVRGVMLLGEYRSASTVTVEVSYDSGQSYPDQASWVLSGLTAGDAVTKDFVQSRIAIDEMRFRLSDSGSGEGLVYNALSVRVEKRRGERRFASADRR